MENSEDRNMPGWARRIDDIGPRRWQRKREYRNRNAEYISSAVFNLVALFVIYKIPDWHLGFINEKYGAVMYVLMFSILAQIAGNLLMVFLNFRVIVYLASIFMESAAFLAQITIYYVYPLDFTNYPGFNWIDVVLPWMLIIGMVVSAVKVISNIWKLIFWR
jgi:hypothetical protein